MSWAPASLGPPSLPEDSFLWDVECEPSEPDPDATESLSYESPEEAWVAVNLPKLA